MTQALVVFNINDFMPPIARHHFLAAAERWGCQFVEIVQPLSDSHWFWQKASIPTSLYVQPYDRVLQLDADMLVMPDCPNPFDVTPSEAFGVVSRVQPGRPGFSFNKEQWGAYYDILPYENAEQHLNAGFLLYRPRDHKALLEEWPTYADPGPWPSPCGVPEQFVLSCLLTHRPIAVHWLPWPFNACRAPWKNGIPDNAYIAHFHGPRHRPLAVQMQAYFRENEK
jgi:hypothetical protein